MNEENNLIVLTDEDGAESTFEFLTEVEMDGKLYAVMAPVEEDNDDSDEREVIVLAIVEDENGEEGYVSLEDENEMERVFQLFLDMVEDEDED